LKMSLEEVFKNELLADYIIKLLPLPDVKNVALVCRSWRLLVECRQYWARATLRIRDEAIFSSPRIQSVRRFKLDRSDTDTELVNLFFSFISDNDDLDVEYLEIDKLSLTTVPTQLASSVCKAAEVQLHDTQLTERQHLYLFRTIGQSSHLKLKKLVLDDLLLDRVDPEILALAVIKVEEIILTRVQLLGTYEVIFKAIRQSEPKLRSLTIQGTYEIMDWVCDVDSMAHALCMVQNVTLDFCDLDTYQLEAIFTNISTSSELHLQTFTLNFDGECFDVSGVSPEVLARAVCRLEKCNLFSSGMASDQVEELCRQIASYENLKLSYLNIGNMEKLEDVEKDILASAAVRLEELEMVYNSTDDQLHAILNRVIEDNDSKLRVLYLEYVDVEEPETRSLLMKVKDKIKIYTVDKNCEFVRGGHCLVHGGVKTKKFKGGYKMAVGRGGVPVKRYQRSYVCDRKGEGLLQTRLSFIKTTLKLSGTENALQLYDCTSKEGQHGISTNTE